MSGHRGIVRQADPTRRKVNICDTVIMICDQLIVRMNIDNVI